MVDININDGQTDEYYGEWCTCPECSSSMIIVYSKYCSRCGVAINWVKGDEE